MNIDLAEVLHHDCNPINDQLRGKNAHKLLRLFQISMKIMIVTLNILLEIERFHTMPEIRIWIIFWCVLRAQCTKSLHKTGMALFTWPYLKIKVECMFKMQIFRKFNS